MTRPLILLSNDDGIRARGLAALEEALAGLGDLLVVAPDQERSAISHAISLHTPLRAEPHGAGRYAVSGTPCDCVYLGVLHLAPRRPALVVSGVNHGFNLGSDVFYSGTLAAAVEGVLRGIPSIAVSTGSLEHQPFKDEDFVTAAGIARRLAEDVLTHGLAPSTVLNVNVPAGKQPRGVCWARLGHRHYRDQVEVRSDLRDKVYYWIGGPATGFGDIEGSDGVLVDQGYASVTPLHLDLTHEGMMGNPPPFRLDRPAG